LTWARCECGCGLEGEDEVTQWLIEEAAFWVLEHLEAEELLGSSAERQAENQLLERHAEMLALRSRLQPQGAPESLG
jgi:hypothetical protein